MERVMEAKNLGYCYPDGTVALTGVDFSLYAGETVAVFGANGSGKTTFLHRLVGLLDGDGEVIVCGERLEKKTLASVRRKVGILFQDSDDQLFMPTVEEDVAFGPLNMGLDGREVRSRVGRALERVGMEQLAARQPYHLSAGEKRRVALAGILAMNPGIILLDEPSTFLDPPARAQLVAILRDLPQAKLLVTHDASLARELAHRAVFFEKGSIVSDGEVDEILTAHGWDMSRKRAALSQQR